MRKHTHSQSAYFNPRIFAAFLLCSLAAWMAMLSFAATPSTGTLSPSNPLINYTVDLQPVANQSPLGLGQLDKGPRCNGTTFPCDSYTLTVDLPAGFVAQNDCAAVKVTMSWTDTDPTGAAPSDYDLYIYPGIVSTLSGNQSAPYQSASGSNPEIAVISPLQDGSHQYSFKVVPYQPAGETPNVRIELISGSGCAGVPNFGGPDPTVPGVPRYQTFVGPADSEGPSGEYNIGFNHATGRILNMNSGPIYRITPAEILSAGAPECCPELWEDVTNLNTITGLDPILWSDQWTDANPLPAQPSKGARIFSSNSTAGTNVVYGYSDDDGDTWQPVSASGPNASSDHETIGSGPYPASLSALATAANHGHAVYYCAQTFPTGAAACQRSDTYGLNYGPSLVMYNPNGPGSIPGSTVFGTQCADLHGHLHVAPDGTVYVPVPHCNGSAGLMVSTDGAVTWTEHLIPNSPIQTHGSDPSVAIDAHNNVYFFYITGNASQSEGHMHVQVSHDHGTTWSNDTDLGASHGIVNAVYPEAVAGDENRVACGFLGTDKPGFYEGITFQGFWYLFIATSYDGGTTWNVVNATPNDPVQGLGGVWQGGGSPDNRNLLDFNEVTMDDKGRVLFGYDKGCIGGCIADPTTQPNNFQASMRVARQIGGKSLLAAYDVAEPALPKAACLSGTRNSTGVHLTWRVPDNGGSPITGYRIFRGNASGNETFLALTGTKASFDDITADPTQPVYYYIKAVNSVGATGGTNSNEVNFVATPGIQLLNISSVKTHAGTDYGITLPLDGSGIECRSGGANGDYALVFDFANAVSSVTGATVSSGTGSVSSTEMQNGNYVVHLSGVTSAQKLTVTLSGVKDSANNTLSSLSATMGVLLGDTTGDSSVNSADISQTKSRSGQTVSATNFRSDVTVDGNLNSADISLVKSKSGTALP